VPSKVANVERRNIIFENVKKPSLGYISSKLQHFPEGLCGHGVNVPLQNISQKEKTVLIMSEFSSPLVSAH